jgi:SnoaL-like domain
VDVGRRQPRARVLHLPRGHVRSCKTMPTSLPPVVADYFAAVNAFDIDAIVATFAPDAYVNDAREINGVDAIRRWVEKEMVGDHVTMEPLEVVGHYGDTIVRSRYDGTFDKTNLPAELVMWDYFRVRARQDRKPRGNPQPAVPVLTGAPVQRPAQRETTSNGRMNYELDAERHRRWPPSPPKRRRRRSGARNTRLGSIPPQLLTAWGLACESPSDTTLHDASELDDALAQRSAR